MDAKTSTWERPEALRERAQWYRDFALVCSGDNRWCINLARYFDQMAAERERRRSGDEGEKRA